MVTRPSSPTGAAAHPAAQSALRERIAAVAGPGPVHFIGIGGAGMSGLARILLEAGIVVTGSDEADSPVLEQLMLRGARVRSGPHTADALGDARCTVYSSAIAPDNPELAEARRRGLPCLRRGEFLARLATAYPTVVAVAGSHGKSTTTAMLAHVLRETGRRPGYLVGGDVRGWPAPAAAGRGDILVTEVDESDGTQALLRSTVAVVTNVDDDHCWSVGGVEALEACFVRFAERAGRLVAWAAPTTRRLFAAHPAPCLIDATGIPPGLHLAVPGEHNRANAALACTVATALGVPPAEALAALASFQGVARRLTERWRAPDAATVVIEDYAHHPVEVQATLQALREAWPGYTLTVVFQPHRFERVRRYAAAFAQALDAADAAWVTPPFAAWVGDSEIADPRDIVRAMRSPHARYWDGSLEELAAELARVPAAAPRLLAVVGAGNVGRLAGLLRAALSAAWIEAAAALVRQQCPGVRLEQTRCWAELTTLGVGRARPLLACPENEAELGALVQTAARHRLPLMLVGAGSNLVGTDADVARLVVLLRQGAFTAMAPCGAGRWRVGAGVTLAALWAELGRHGSADPAFAPLAWIPGTLGGALHNNAGAHGSEIGRFVERLHGVDAATGEPWEAAGADIAWRYRAADIPAGIVITAAVLRFQTGAPAASAAAAYAESGRRRAAALPLGRTAGSAFRNPGDAAAGRLVEQAGCKGWRRGGCEMSPQHANVLVNRGTATEREVLELLAQVRRQVRETTGVLLMPEVTFAGEGVEQALAEREPPPRVVVLKGGPSTENAVSLRSGAAVAQALRSAGFAVAEVELTAAVLPPLPPRTDVVFPVLHGAFGEDGQLQALLEQRGIPFVGSGSAACAVIMEKIASKECFRAAGVPTPGHARIAAVTSGPPADLRFPLVVKPSSQGSTFGITKVKGPSGWWRRALKKAFALDRSVFAEEFIAGTEITVAVLAGQALPVVEILPPRGRMFDYDAKYDHRRGHTRYNCPPTRVPAAAQAQAQRLAEAAFGALGAKDLLRVDFIVDDAGIPWALEANAIPGFTATSLFPKAAQAAGLSFVELCARLVRANL
jgi:UDP-N-acetylmuramate--alanine ligase